MAYLSNDQLLQMGFKSFGSNVKISDKASIYGAANIEIGNDVRIDDFCILSAGVKGIRLGDYIHIACYSSLMGQGAIIMEDFSGLSSRVAIYSSTDDYSGKFLTNPTVPSDFTNVISGDVVLKKHVIVGVGATILPNVTVGAGSAIAAYSLVNRDVDEYTIAGGIPAKFLKERHRNIFELEKQLREQ